MRRAPISLSTKSLPLRNRRRESRTTKRIGSNHTTPEQAGEVFARSKPKLAVYNHLLLFGGATAEDLIPATRKHYSGPLLVREDLMHFDVGEDIEAQQFSNSEVSS